MKDIATIFSAIKLRPAGAGRRRRDRRGADARPQAEVRTWRDVVFAIAAPIPWSSWRGKPECTSASSGRPCWSVVGAVAGYFAGRGSTFVADEGKLKLRRSPVGPWLWAVSVIVAALTALFGSAYLFALAMLLLIFAACEVAGQSIAELTQAKPGAAGAGVPAVPLPEAGAPAVTA